MLTPWSRPRIRSGAYVWRIDWRFTALTRSAPPATASSTTASHSCCASPAAAIARPQAITAATRTRPCRRTRLVQPDVSPPSIEPIAIALNSQPAAAPPPKRSSAASGKSDFGIASTMAMMSIANDRSSTGVVARYLSPSATLRSPIDRCSPSGGIDGSRTVAQNERAKSTPSIA
jgi:hypothetical protein